MKYILIAGILALGAGNAFAADVVPGPVPVAANAYYPSPSLSYSWSGPYIGVNGGYGFGTSDWSDPNNPSGATSTGNFEVSGPLVGITVGANFQIDHFVFGPEGDFDYDVIKGSAAPSNGFCALTTASFATSTNCETRNTWLGTARIRLGYAADRILVYGTGGLALGDIHAAVTGPGIVPTYDSNAELGWTAGGGLEFALAHNWTAKAEYLFVSLDHGTCTSLNCGADGFNFATFALVPADDVVKFSMSVVRVGIDYKFDWE